MHEQNLYRIYPVDTIHHFSEMEALEIVGPMMNITAKAKKHINALKQQIEVFSNQPKKYQEALDKYNDGIKKWGEKITRLGGIPVGLFSVQIPTAGGHFLWEHPRDNVFYYPIPVNKENLKIH